MLLGLAWYWWLLGIVVIILSIPYKIKALKGWKKYQQEQKRKHENKWGDES